MSLVKTYFMICIISSVFSSPVPADTYVVAKLPGKQFFAFSFSSHLFLLMFQQKPKLLLETIMHYPARELTKMQLLETMMHFLARKLTKMLLMETIMDSKHLRR